MSGYLIDTDWIVDVLKGQTLATQTLLELAPQGLSVSLISYGELYEGAYYARDPKGSLTSVQVFLEGKDILPLTTEITERFAVVRGGLPRRLRNQVGDMDLLIAATALTHNLTLLTRNIRDFENIPDLSIYHAN